MIAIAQMMISVFPISPFPIYLHSVARFIFLYGYIHIPFFCSKTSRATHCLQDKNLGCHSSLCLIVSLSSNITFYYHHCECSTPFRPISTFFSHPCYAFFYAFVYIAIWNALWLSLSPIIIQPPRPIRY